MNLPIKSITFILLCLFVISGCKAKKESAAYFESEEQFSKLINDLNTKFSNQASYSSIMLSYDTIMGNTVLVKVHSGNDSTALHEWFYINGQWDDKSVLVSDSTLKLTPEKLFSINTEFNLLKIVEMVDKAKQKAKDEKKLKSVECKGVSILMKNVGNSENKMDNLIIQFTIVSDDGLANFELSFSSDGEFKGFLN